MEISTSILDLIGNTPMVKLKKITERINASVLVKLEYLNPSGSLKDRIALRMIEGAEESGKLKPGYTIIDASTGNTGIALSFIGTMRGYKVVIYMPGGMTLSQERAKIMEDYGAEVVFVSPEEEKIIMQELMKKDRSISGAEIEVPLRQKCLDIERNSPNTYWIRQFSNLDNVKAHHDTGKEMLLQTDNKVDAFVASVGTGGTLLGVAEILKEENPNVKIIAVEPAGSEYPLILGYRRIPGADPEISGGLIEKILDKGIVDEVVQVTDQEAIDMSRRLIKEEGLFAGVSSGANVLVAIREAQKIGTDKNVVTVLPDSRDRYFTSEHYNT